MWGNDWNHVTEDAKDVVRKLLVVDPKQRLTAEEVAFVFNYDIISLLRNLTLFYDIFSSFYAINGLTKKKT